MLNRYNLDALAEYAGICVTFGVKILADVWTFFRGLC